MKKIAAMLLTVVLFLALMGCQLKYAEYMPPDGHWYCEELQIQISFFDDECYAIRSGEKIDCCVENDQGSKVFTVLCAQENITDLPVGTLIFEAVYVELADNKFTVRELKTNDIYVFKRVE